jgi:mannose-1-phosphate guanylyltransferase
MSRKSYPKQFLPLINDQSLLLQTLKRVSTLNSSVLMLGSEEHRFLISDELQSMDLDVNLILEPCSRNTAAAMGLAALFKISQTAAKTGQHNELLLFCPADHHIPNHQLFKDVVEQGTKAALEGHVVTFGIQPTHPNTGYGYIQFNPHSCAPALDVLRFVEKPALTVAKKYLAAGDYVWNAGMFFWGVRVVEAALARHAPELHAGLAPVRTALAAGRPLTQVLKKIYPTLPKISVDYALLEKSDNVVVLPSTFDWDDVGAWPAVVKHCAPDAHGNVTRGCALVEQGRGNLVFAEGGHLVAVLGADDLIVVHTPDATLVCPKGRAQEIKALLKRIETMKDGARWL